MTMITPNHEQHYPSLLLPTRLEEYVRDDTPPTRDRRSAVMVTAAQVITAVEAAKKARGLSHIDARYFVGTVFHESGCLNEWDTEIATASSPSGFVSVGAFQIGLEEAQRYGYGLIDMLDLNKSSDCMVRMAEFNLQSLQTAVANAAARGKMSNLDYKAPDGSFWKDGGARAYLAMAHNHGNGYVRTTIANYGLDWTRYKIRNPHDHIVDHGYGEDCVTGGAQWPSTP